VKVLIACEFSGIVREAFRAKGHDAWSCDLLPTETLGQHIQGDVLEILDEDWDLMIAHPPCQYLCNSGVRWLKNNPDRVFEMKFASVFFKTLFECDDIPMIAVENPIQHKYARQIIRHNYSQIIQPWMFGHGETKATCLWLKNLPLLKPTNIVDGRAGRVHREPPGPDRWKNRSRTYRGIAEAMADQWGGPEGT